MAHKSRGFVLSVSNECSSVSSDEFANVKGILISTYGKCVL